MARRLPIVDEAVALQRHQQPVGGRGRDARALREIGQADAVRGCHQLQEVEGAIERLHDIFARGPAVRRDVRALRAVQSMAVLDVRNYRDIVFRLGGYGDDGEDSEPWCTLP